MLCEKYKPALIDAAVTGAGLPPVVRAHTESCATCAAELAQQCSLVAAIDASLHQTMNAPIPAAMLQRFEAQIAQQPQPTRFPRFAQIFVGALATLAVAAAILLALPRHWSHGSDARLTDPQPTHDVVANQSQVDSNPPPEPQAPEAASYESQTRSHARTHSILASTAALNPEPEVLVPPEDRIAFEHFIADFDGRAVLAATLAKQVPMQDLRVAPLDVPDIQTASLTVASVGESKVISNR